MVLAVIRLYHLYYYRPSIYLLGRAADDDTNHLN